MSKISDLTGGGSAGGGGTVAGATPAEAAQIAANAATGAQNAADVATNAATAATNAAAVAQNMVDIGGNDTDIAANAAAVASAAADVATNAAAVAQNVADIATNESDIADNATDIASNTTLISASVSAALQFTMIDGTGSQYTITGSDFPVNKARYITIDDSGATIAAGAANAVNFGRPLHLRNVGTDDVTIGTAGGVTVDGLLTIGPDETLTLVGIGANLIHATGGK